MKMYAKNKKGLFDYEILEKYEAGLVLRGNEVKSIRNGNVSLKGSYVSLKDGELYLVKAHVSQYQYAAPNKNYDPERRRKLLVHKREIESLIGKMKQKGLTLIPISLYNKNRRIKLEFALARGKKKHDKRQTIKKRDSDRKLQQLMRQK